MHSLFWTCNNGNNGPRSLQRKIWHRHLTRTVSLPVGPSVWALKSASEFKKREPYLHASVIATLRYTTTKPLPSNIYPSSFIHIRIECDSASSILWLESCCPSLRRCPNLLNEEESVNADIIIGFAYCPSISICPLLLIIRAVELFARNLMWRNQQSTGSSTACKLEADVELCWKLRRYDAMILVREITE